MIDKTENIDNWSGRILILIFFFFMLSFSNENDSNSNSDCQRISFEQVIDGNETATIVKPVSLPVYNDTFENCIRFDIESWNNKFDLTISNKKVNQQYKTEELRYYEFKPSLLRLQLSFFRLTSTEDYLLVS